MSVVKCNGCWRELEIKTQCVATSCGHLYCLPCAQNIIEGDSSCPICDSIINKSNIKVAVIQEPSGCKLALCGQTPETVMHSATAAINFAAQQQALQAEYMKAQLEKKIAKLQEACRKKLEEVHNGYTTAKRKYNEAMQRARMLEEDNQELQAKYSQKAMQAKKLQETVQQLQQQNEGLRRSAQGKTMYSTFDDHGGAEMVTTVHRTQVFGTMPGASPPLTTGNFGGQPHGVITGSGGRSRPNTPAGFIAATMDHVSPAALAKRPASNLFAREPGRPQPGDRLQQLLGNPGRSLNRDSPQLPNSGFHFSLRQA